MCFIASDFQRLLTFGNLLREHFWEVEFYFTDKETHALMDCIKIAESHKFKCHYSIAKANSVSGTAALFNQERRGSKIKNWLKEFKPILFLSRLFAEMRSINKIKRRFSFILKERKISLVVTSQNSTGFDLPVYLNTCRQLNINSLMIPFVVRDFNSYRNIISNIPRSSPSYLLNNVFSFALSRWTIINDNKVYLVLPAERILAFIFKKVKVHKPISLYSVVVDRILVENNYAKEIIVQETGDSKNIKVTGSIFDDLIFNLSKNKNELYKVFCEKNSLSFDKPLILIALPPFIKTTKTDERFFDYDELIDKYLPTSLDRNAFNVLVSLHPRIHKFYNNDFIDFVRTENEILITKKPVEWDLPLCDLFISTFSSTIKTAAQLNIPVINYDIFRFKYSIFDHLSNITYAFTEEEFTSEVNKWLEGYTSRDEQSFSNTINCQFDGMARKRIVNEVFETLKNDSDVK